MERVPSWSLRLACLISITILDASSLNTTCCLYVYSLMCYTIVKEIKNLKVFFLISTHWLHQSVTHFLLWWSCDAILGTVRAFRRQSCEETPFCLLWDCWNDGIIPKQLSPWKKEVLELKKKSSKAKTQEKGGISCPCLLEVAFCSSWSFNQRQHFTTKLQKLLTVWVTRIWRRHLNSNPWWQILLLLIYWGTVTLNTSTVSMSSSEDLHRFFWSFSLLLFHGQWGYSIMHQIVCKSSNSLFHWLSLRNLISRNDSSDQWITSLRATLFTNCKDEEFLSLLTHPTKVPSF